VRKSVRHPKTPRSDRHPPAVAIPATKKGLVLRRLILALVAALALTLVFTQLRAQEVSLPIGTQGPAAALEDLDGNPVDLLDFVEEGKPALIEFWASWCHECEALDPEMSRVQEVFGDRASVVAVAVAVSQSQRRVKKHVADFGTSHTFLWDGEGNAVRNYKVPGTSVVVILDSQGKVAYTGSGPDQDLVGAMEKVLGG